MAFEHGVASGDPDADRVIIWTRVTTTEASLPVRWRVARDEGLTDVVAEGATTADAARDHTVHVDVEGLDPGTSYWYGFALADGTASPTGRTRTLAEGDAPVRFAMCSCAKYNAGFFTAYGRIAAREDVDFLLHLGDYVYEAAQKPPASQTASKDIGRPFDPLEECRTLDDYRRRYAQYRRDPDVQALHARHAMIATLDDHELADGAWAGGSTEHRPDEHGPWASRRDVALQARWEWLPARMPDPADPTRVFRSVRLGDLAELFLLDVRSRRDEPVAGPPMDDPGRSMLGAEQREWLLDAADASTAAWRLVASPSILGGTWVPSPQEPLRTALLKLKLVDEDGERPDEDQWDGYPAERAALLDRLGAHDDVVVLSGDIHVSLAAHLGDGIPEFTTPSLTSQNLDEKLGVDQRAPEVLAAEAAFVEAFDRVAWCELASHGYVVLDVTPERVRAEWWHVDTVLAPESGERRAAAYEVVRGARARSTAALSTSTAPAS